MHDHSHRRLRRSQGHLAGKGDQALREFRDVYDALSDVQKQQFLDAITKVAEANDILSQLPAQLHAAIETYWVAREDDGEVLGSGHAELSPKLLLKAIKAWGRGQVYTPGGRHFIY